MEEHTDESKHRQRLLKSKTNLERAICKLSCSLFSHNCVLLTYRTFLNIWFLFQGYYLIVVRIILQIIVRITSFAVFLS